MRRRRRSSPAAGGRVRRATILVATPLTLTLLAAEGSGAGLFGAPQNTAVPDRLLYVTGADLDGDNQLDLVVSPYLSNVVYTLLRSAGGGFETPVPYLIGGAKDVVCVDITGDGRLDLVAALEAGAVSLNRGHGDGTFEPMINLAAGVSPAAVAVGDLTNDGVLDLVVGNFAGGTVSVLRGLGGTTYAPMQEFPAGGDVSHVGLGDFDEDGRLDVVATNTSFVTLSILLGNGDGTLRPMTQRSVAGDAMHVVIADLNHDQHLDLAVANNLSFASVLLGDGTGGFGPLAQYPAGFGTLSIDAADLDGDTHFDLALTNAIDNTVSVLLGRGDGTFLPRTDYPTGEHPIEVTIGDFTDDHRPDLVTANFESRQVSLLPGVGTPVSIVEEATTALSIRAFPNPGRGRIQLRCSMPEAGPTSLRIFDVQGRLVDELPAPATSPGVHLFEWRPRSARRAAGVYWCRLEAGGRVVSVPVTVLE